MAFERGYAHLTPFQHGVFAECVVQQSGGLSLPMGSGKTLLSLVLALKDTEGVEERNALSLVVVAKSLIATWEMEIQKFFGDTLPYEVMHRSRLKKNYDTWRPAARTKIVITTPQAIAAAYKAYVVSELLVSLEIDRTKRPPLQIKYYANPTAPFLRNNMGPGLFFSRTWHTLVVDEIQQYTNIGTQVCQGLVAIHARARWLISGTVFDEPRAERVLGYLSILNWPDTPRNLPDTESYIRGRRMHRLRGEHIAPFEGLKVTMVLRETNEMFTPPHISERVVKHTLNEAEQNIYLAMKEILYEVCRRAREMRETDPEGARVFSTYRMAMLTYLRQAIICPCIPLASAALDMSDYKKKSTLANIFMDKIRELRLDTWLDDEAAVKSSRIQAICEEAERYKDERIVMFSCFRTTLNMMRYYLPDDRQILTLSPNMSITKRGEVIAEFERTRNGILLLTYTLGANGLNLQCSSTVFLCDFWWNAGKTRQAIARILRFGQKAPRVNIVYFTSNTGLEQVIFEKQKIKDNLTAELMKGVQTSTITRLKIEDIIRMIALAENDTLLRSIYM